MKKYLPLAFVLLLAWTAVSMGQASKATPAPAPSPSASASASPAPKPAMSKAQIQKSLIATEKKLWEAWKHKDPKPFKATLAADAVMVGESGIGDKASSIKAITSPDCEVKSYALSDFKVALANSSVALITYKATVDGTCGGVAIPAVWSSSVYVNRGGKWYAFSHQESNVK